MHCGLHDLLQAGGYENGYLPKVVLPIVAGTPSSVASLYHSLLPDKSAFCIASGHTRVGSIDEMEVGCVHGCHLQLWY